MNKKQVIMYPFINTELTIAQEVLVSVGKYATLLPLHQFDIRQLRIENAALLRVRRLMLAIMLDTITASEGNEFTKHLLRMSVLGFVLKSPHANITE